MSPFANETYTHSELKRMETEHNETMLSVAESNFDFNKTDSGESRFIPFVDHHSSAATCDCRFVLFRFHHKCSRLFSVVRNRVSAIPCTQRHNRNNFMRRKIQSYSAVASISFPMRTPLIVCVSVLWEIFHYDFIFVPIIFFLLHFIFHIFTPRTHSSR